MIKLENNLEELRQADLENNLQLIKQHEPSAIYAVDDQIFERDQMIIHLAQILESIKMELKCI